MTVMVNFVRYIAATGVKTCYGTCADTDVAIQASGSGEAALAIGNELGINVASVDITKDPPTPVMVG
jgi:hypothetical protein